MARRTRPSSEPVTMGHVRSHGCRDLLVYCTSSWCHHSAKLSGDFLSDDTVLLEIEPRFVCTALWSDWCRRKAELEPAYGSWWHGAGAYLSVRPMRGLNLVRLFFRTRASGIRELGSRRMAFMRQERWSLGPVAPACTPEVSTWHLRRNASVSPNTQR
jgi:hypothetical protein